MKQRIAALALGLLFIAAAPMRAQLVWTGTGGGGNVLLGTNWSSGLPTVAPLSMDFPFVTNRTVTFDQSLIAALLGNITASDITFSGGTAGNYVLNGTGSPTLQLNGNIYATSTPAISITFDTTLGLQLSSGSHAISPATNNDIQILGVVSGSGGISKVDTGNLTLSGANTYTGSTTIAGGTLTLTSLGNGAGASTVGSSSSAATNLVLDGGILRYTGGNGSTDRLLAIGPSGGIIYNSNPTVAGGFSFTNTGDIGFTGTNTSQTLTLAGNPIYSSTVYFSPRITDNGTGLTSVVAANGSFWRFSAPNTYTGGTTIQSGGTLIAINTTGSATGTGLVTINSGGRLVIGSNSPDGIVGSNILNNGSLEFNRSSNYTYAGAISGTGAISFNPTSTVTLTGTSTFSGATNLANASLVVAANSALGTSTVNINGGKLLLGGGVSFGNVINFGGSGGTLGGDGTLTGPQSFNGSITLAPGIANTGTLSFDSGLLLNNGITAAIDIKSATGAAGAGQDLINVAGTLDLENIGANGFTLKVISLNLAGTPGAVSDFVNTTPYTWTIFSTAFLDSFVASQFVIDSSGFTNGLGGGTFSVFDAGNNIYLQFTPVPEPSTYALLGAGLVATALAARRKRRA